MSDCWFPSGWDDTRDDHCNDPECQHDLCVAEREAAAEGYDEYPDEYEVTYA